MSETVRISIDAMGGDVGPEVVIPGCALALERRPGVSFLLFGDEARINPVLDGHPALAAASTIVHTDVMVRMDDKPSQALRHGRRRSSMWLALEAVGRKEADMAISAGNTGALMAMAKFALRTMANVDRPAIAATWPTLRGESIVLDLGATIGADAWQLVDFAVMGQAMARAVLGIENPTVGLLNIGVEEVKGLEEVRLAGQLLRGSDHPIDYRGFVEGDDIGKGTVDVVVTEGFTGNIALKTAEGTAMQFATYLRAAMNRSWLTKLGGLLARSAFEQMRARLDPRKVNGGVFLGLNGIVVKSHGGTDAEGFANAVDIGIEVVRFHLLDHIAKGLEAFRGSRPQTVDGAKE
ncbi:MAG: phosphate acyltransferase PlsX [Rhodobiaceae bacterium]|nr:phosphate acyltransferase PlsX [Rhodobiaceae bacterium]MCC0056421.1 phosphate acyltransferase PlsX [Rhodobiaceae bacterium]